MQKRELEEGSSKADARGVVVMMKKGERAGLLDCWRSRFRDYLGKYHVFLSADMIDRSLVQDILASNCIAGLMIVDPESKVDPTEALSHDGACPNPKSGIYEDGCTSTSLWNEKGYVLPDGLRNIDWNMQILYLFNKTHIDAIKKCHDLFNVPKDGAPFVSFPFCAASFGVFSTAAGSSEICYRRSKPWSRLFDIDSFGIIPEISPGEISVLTSVIALLATTRSIGQHLDVFERAANTSGRHVIVAFFDGESFDYIGSSDAAYDMMNDEFPRKLRMDLKAQLDPVIASQLDSIVEVQQLGTGDGSASLYALADGRQFEKGELKHLLKALTAGATAAGGSLNAPTAKSRVPPASWHSFARHEPSIRGVVLAPFRDEYNYRRVNSILDRAQWTSAQRSAAITEVLVAASAMLRAAADHVGLDTAQQMALDIDKDFVSHSQVTSLFECFIDEPDWFKCDFFNKLNGGRFKASTGYDFSNGTYSTWTESLYSIDNLRLYLVEQESFEKVMLGLGIVIAIVSFLVVGRCNEESFIIDEGERLAEEGEPL
ncbi:Nicastrin [Ancylostoma ceylanicum]|uniref:Nicastrin n=1 Tax=Ancylostoma ceylanicum TaxID=53326 RepID=A0A0D6M068_9BILA|nr:Nicastrin [Ancylostoma ceylanicum]